ncbi:MAG: YitT family protein [Lachnospiraceae bacterium]|nr:YitT family protein [Candidatus Fimimorpha excrementavium]
MNRQTILPAIQKFLLILIGNTIYAAAVVMFLLPNDLMSGGTTGLGLFFQNQFHLPIAYFVGVFNILMFLLGAWILGKTFAMTTLVSTFYYPICLDLLQRIPFLQGMTENTMLAVLFSGLMIGVGIGIVIRAGASTGGMDIPPLILNKKFGLSVSFMLYVFDFCILLLQMTFSDKERILYGILLVIIYTMVLNKVLLTGKSQMQVKIVSRNYREISEMISSQLDRGCTLLHAETGYLHLTSMVVLTVISNRELPRLNQKVMELDPKAFMVINQVNEVRGRGFTLTKKYK